MSKSFSEPKDTGLLPGNKWMHVCFTIKTKKHWELLLAKESYLHELGIYFDTGAGFGQRDWELDWSFSCNR